MVKIMRFRVAAEICTYVQSKKWMQAEFKEAIRLLHNDFAMQEQQVQAPVMVQKTVITKGKRPVSRRRYLNK